MTATTIAPVVSAWTHPATGEVRHYVNNVADLLGLRVSTYNSGNVQAASLDGVRISNRQATQMRDRLASAKVWFTDEGWFWTGLSDAEGERVSDLVDAAGV